jgi:hypothetical protein
LATPRVCRGCPKCGAPWGRRGSACAPRRAPHSGWQVLLFSPCERAQGCLHWIAWLVAGQGTVERLQRRQAAEREQEMWDEAMRGAARVWVGSFRRRCVWEGRRSVGRRSVGARAGARARWPARLRRGGGLITRRLAAALGGGRGPLRAGPHAARGAPAPSSLSRAASAGGEALWQQLANVGAAGAI